MVCLFYGVMHAQDATSASKGSNAFSANNKKTTTSATMVEVINIHKAATWDATLSHRISPHLAFRGQHVLCPMSTLRIHG